MKTTSRLFLLLFLCCTPIAPAFAADAPVEKWDGLVEITSRFSWYPRPDVQKLLETKTAEYGQSLEEYRTLLLRQLGNGDIAAERLRSGDFATGHPWRQYYRLSLAEFCLYLATDREIHLQNAETALSVLAEKTDQPEIEFWTDIYRCHRACLDKDRKALIAAAFHLWQNVILRFELETLIFPNPEAQIGFVRNLPFLYENLAHLILRKAIVEQEIPDLYPLSSLILDIQPKLSLENGYKTMVDQVVERMHGVNSDNRNINYAVALLEATAKRYDFEDEKDPANLPAKYNLTRKYYLLAYDWADTGKGKAALLTEQMGFFNYVIRRFGGTEESLPPAFFTHLPAQAREYLETGIGFYDQLAAAGIEQANGRSEGFEDRKIYVQGMHQLWDSTAKLAIILADYNRRNRPPEDAGRIFPAARPLEMYCDLFARHARNNPDIVPDNAYFLTAYAARELAALYRQHARYSTDSRADQLAFAYQLQAMEIFPLDLPGVLQLAFQSTVDGRVRDYFQYSTPLAARLRASEGAAGWSDRHPGEYVALVNLVPSVVPEVIDNAFLLLQHVPEGEMPEDELFVRTVAMGKILVVETAAARDTEAKLDAIGRGAAADLPGKIVAQPFFELKNRLYGATENPVHSFLRTLFNEIPYDAHQYVALRQNLR